jgi:Ca2+-binding RTX toxin-like protein
MLRPMGYTLAVVGLMMTSVASFETARAGTPTCSYNEDSSVVRVRLEQRSYIGLVRRGSAIHVFVDGGPTSPCGEATVHNTDEVRVVDDVQGFAGFTINMKRGYFAPGSADEPLGADEIEFRSAGSATDEGQLTFVLGGSDVNDFLTFGRDGGTMNRDRDLDIRLEGITRYSLIGLAGADDLSLQGSRVTGAPVDPPGDRSAAIHGGSGNDFILGAPNRDIAKGGRGRDTLMGNGGSDVMSGGPRVDELFGNQGPDLVDAGRGADGLFGGKAGDTLLGARGDDHLDGDAGNDRCTGGGGDNRYEECEQRD